jgi:hypothetical protein
MSTTKKFVFGDAKKKADAEAKAKSDLEQSEDAKAKTDQEERDRKASAKPDSITPQKTSDSAVSPVSNSIVSPSEQKSDFKKNISTAGSTDSRQLEKLQREIEKLKQDLKSSEEMFDDANVLLQLKENELSETKTDLATIKRC